MKNIYKPLLFLIVFSLTLGGMYWKSVQDIPNPISKPIDPNPATQEISKVTENLTLTEELNKKPNSQKKSTTNKIGSKKRNNTAPTQSSPISSKPHKTSLSDSKSNADPNCKKCKALKKIINVETNQTLKSLYQHNINLHPNHTTY
jgi:hypothetical protein